MQVQAFEVRVKSEVLKQHRTKMKKLMLNEKLASKKIPIINSRMVNYWKSSGNSRSGLLNLSKSDSNSLS